MYSLSNWFDVFNSVCERGDTALDWDLPESWVHAELYAELRKRSDSTGWMPFFTEIPYVTALPVQLPKPTYRDWKTVGAVKWVDLCLKSQVHNAWCWFEFKVRKIGSSSRKQKAALSARDAFRKDVVALMGFDVSATAETWLNPDTYTIAYWFPSILQPAASDLESGKHYFVAAFLQLGGELDPMVWGEEILKEQVRGWLAHRSRQRGCEDVCPIVEIRSQLLKGGHSLLICEWNSIWLSGGSAA